MADHQGHSDFSGQEHGRIDEAISRVFPKSGLIAPDEPVWDRSTNSWIPASQLFAPAPVTKTLTRVSNTDFEYNEKVYSESSEATDPTIDAFKILLSDPLGGQRKAFDALGESNALSTGVLLLAAFVVSRLSYAITVWGIHPRLILPGLGVATLSLTSGILVIGKIFGGESQISRATFTAGISLLPITICFGLLKVAGLRENQVFDLPAVVPFAPSDILPVVQEFENPRHAEFQERNAWNLYQDCTEIMKEQSPARQVDGFKALNQVMTAACV